MAFNPNSTIYLCNVPFDNSYKNQVYFSSKSTQTSYFTGKVVRTYSDYLTVRKVLPSGAFQSSVKVQGCIDELRAKGVNYLFYQNANHGTKYFYAFINQLIYINEDTTEIVFETDVFQTWLFDITILDSFVVREHSTTDEIGDNVVPEKFSYSDFKYFRLKDIPELAEWGYLIATTEHLGADGSRGKMMSGIYQGLYFYYFHNSNNLNDFLDAVEEEGGDCVQFIAVIPKFCLKNNSINSDTGEGYVAYSDSPAKTTVSIDFSAYDITFDGYSPKNNKLYTAPYFSLLVSNHSGQEATYNIEDFWNRNAVEFELYGDVSANPSLALVPTSYKGVGTNYDSGLTIQGFPQCSFNTDSFKLWLAKNQYSISSSMATNLGAAVTGIASGVAGNPMGGIQAWQGIQGINNTVNQMYQASKEANRAHGGSSKSNLLTAMKFNKFDFYVQYIKKDYAMAVDDFFTMYGYQTNKLKKPNLNSRPYFNYIQTIDINITGGIPTDDMERLKTVFNNGVTLWKPTATIGDYSVDNSPV